MLAVLRLRKFKTITLHNFFVFSETRTIHIRLFEKFLRSDCRFGR
jgi:hypothetical protein